MTTQPNSQTKAALTWTARIVRYTLHDGDTLTNVHLDVGWGVIISRSGTTPLSVRLTSSRGPINAPELYGPEAVAGKLVRTALDHDIMNQWDRGRTLWLVSREIDRDAYGRCIGEIHCEGEDLGTVMLERGLVKLCGPAKTSGHARRARGARRESHHESAPSHLPARSRAAGARLRLLGTRSAAVKPNPNLRVPCTQLRGACAPPEPPDLTIRGGAFLTLRDGASDEGVLSTLRNARTAEPLPFFPLLGTAASSRSSSSGGASHLQPKRREGSLTRVAAHSTSTRGRRLLRACSLQPDRNGVAPSAEGGATLSLSERGSILVLGFLTACGLAATVLL